MAGVSRTKPIIGVTGSIGAGKSTVSRLLAELGCVVIDSDTLAHETLQEPEVKDRLAAWWGRSVIDDQGRVNRKAVADAVFDRPAELERLEGVLYPRIHQRRHRLVAEAERDPACRAVVLDVPKLYEAGVDAECDAVIVVDADPNVRERRVADRGWSARELNRREKLLEPLDRKKRLADHVIVNNDGIAPLRRKVEEVFGAVLAGFTRPDIQDAPPKPDSEPSDRAR